jgi:ABC-type multidrug transport system fused ATPase/permease subunit
MSNPYISLLKTAWQYAQKDRKRFVGVYTMFICSNLIDACHPVLFGWFIDKIQKDNNRILHFVGIYGAAYVGLKLAEWAFHGPARVMERQLAFNMSRNFLDELYHQALHLPVKWHQDHHSGATINRIRKAYEALKSFFESGFLYLHAFAKFFFSFAAMVYFSPLFGSIGVLMGLLTIWVIFKFDKYYIKSLDEVNEQEHVISSTLFDSLSNIITVITLRLERSMQAGLMEKLKQLLLPWRKNTVINEWKWFAADILVALTYCVIVVGYVYQNWSPDRVFYISGLVILIGYVNQFTSVFHDVAWQYTEIVKNNTNIQTAKAINDAFRENHRADSETVLPANWQTIDIKNLNFSHLETYDETQRAQSLHDISIRIKRGQRIALIGESGSGKSTVLSLLRGLYAPENQCEMFVDKVKTSLSTLNTTVTLFPQEPEIFENTILYNITLGLPFEETLVAEVCENAYFSDVVTELPRGLASNIQEKGVNLSGGQKQRLALARGILAARESQVVLLDEPTSSVDPKTEAMIYERLFAAFADKAVVSALHRLHLLRQFDYVYILQKGAIVDEGTFTYLLQNSAIFQDLWRHQEDV